MAARPDAQSIVALLSFRIGLATMDFGAGQLARLAAADLAVQATNFTTLLETDLMRFETVYPPSADKPEIHARIHAMPPTPFWRVRACLVQP